MDSKTEYFHIIISASQDECSDINFNDVFALNMMLKKVTKNFKTACINFNSKEKTLIKEISQIMVSAQNPDHEKSTKIWSAKHNNIKEIMVKLADWFEEQVEVVIDGKKQLSFHKRRISSTK